MSLNQDSPTAQAHAYAARWQFQPDGDIFFTHSSLLWPVLRDGESLMLKIPNPDDDEAAGANVLRFFGGQGAVRLVESDGHVQLLERIVNDPSMPTLEQMALAGDDERATHIICDVIEQLHAVTGKVPDTLTPFRNRQIHMRQYVEEGRVKPADRPRFDDAYDLTTELIAETKNTERLLHGDIHHFNVMHAARGWLAIDPKGILGPRVYEYAALFINPWGNEAAITPARMERRASIIAERSGIDKKLLLAFAYIHAMQCAAWSLHEPSQIFCLACGETAAKLVQA